GGEKINPAWEAVSRIKDEIAGAEVIKLQVPTVFKKSIEKLEAGIEEHKPDAVICVGQAGGRFDVTPERVAINIDDARIKDNEGNQPIDVSVFEDGAPAYFATLPVKAIVKEINAAGLPSTLSNTAGTFVCNHIMYGALYLADKKYPNMRAGFIHVPYIPQQVVDKKGTPSMALEDIVKSLEAAVKAVVENDQDIKATGGTIC
ncbi:MAG: pyroglutamyl-peptidase I, partial [Clostridiaceae bacterium]